MATDNKNKVLNVPNLRFPGFGGEWEREKLRDKCSFYSGGTPSSSNKSYYNGEIPFIRSGEISGDSTELFLSEFGLNNSSAKMVDIGDLLLALYGATSGQIAISKIRGAINQAILCIKSSYDNIFLKSVWEKHVDKILQAYLQGGQGNLSADIVKNLSFYFPSLDEQNKISKLIVLIDERIETQNKIIEQLQSLIKGIYDKTFANFSKYQTLSAICKIQKGQQINGEELSEFGEYYVMNGGIEPSGYYDKYNTMPNTISISEGGNSCGYIQFNTVPFWSGGHCYTLQGISTEYNTHFVYHYLKSKEKEIMSLRIGSGLPNIQKKDLEIFPIPELSLETQIRISNGINKIETKLKQEKNMLSAYQTQKAYLLRNLFI